MLLRFQGETLHRQAAYWAPLDFDAECGCVVCRNGALDEARDLDLARQPGEGVMADKTVDARGLSCPEPVLRVRDAINHLTRGTIAVLVDTATSCENVTRMAESLSCRVEATESEDAGFTLIVTKD